MSNDHTTPDNLEIFSNVKIQSENYDAISPYIEELGGLFRNYGTAHDMTGFYSLTMKSDEKPTSRHIYALIRQEGFSGGVYGLRICHKEKPSGNEFKVLFAAAGLDMALSDIKK